MPWTVAIFNDLGGGELLVLVIIGLLIFGKDLPHMARKWGKMTADFKRNMAEASTELQREMNLAASELDEARNSAAGGADVLTDLDQTVRRIPSLPEHAKNPAAIPAIPATNPAPVPDAVLKDIPKAETALAAAPPAPIAAEVKETPPDEPAS